MCLTIKKDAECLIAEEDIVCYKILTKGIPKDTKTMGKYHGKKCTAKMKQESLSGNSTVFVYGRLSCVDDEVHICHNNSHYNDANALDKFGYRYSWSVDSQVLEIIVGEDIIKPDSLVTDYREVFIEIGETYNSELVRNPKPLINFCYFIEEGLHSYANLEDVINPNLANNVSVKCIIPKGAKYYKGMFLECAAYASDTLKYVEIIQRDKD